MSLINTSSGAGAQSTEPDERNVEALVYVNGKFIPRAEATVSVFDAGYVCGDGVWEGVRIVRGRVIALDAHLDRLHEGARAIAMDIGMSRDKLREVIHSTFSANGIDDGGHARLMVTRGVKTTPNQDPRSVLGAPTVVCVAERKVVSAQAKQRGLTLFTSTFRCSTPDVFDLRLNSHSRLNLIQALIQALQAGADEALMLDTQGFVSSCNSTNFFVVRGDQLWTSSGRACFNGITRATVIRLARDAGIQVVEGDFTLTQAYGADEAFVTGTLAGIMPVSHLDGRPFTRRTLTERLGDLYNRYLQQPDA